MKSIYSLIALPVIAITLAAPAFAQSSTPGGGMGGSTDSGTTGSGNVTPKSAKSTKSSKMNNDTMGKDGMTGGNSGNSGNTSMGGAAPMDKTAPSRNPMAHPAGPGSGGSSMKGDTSSSGDWRMSR